MVQPHEKPVLVALPRELATAFKVACVQRSCSMKSVLETAVVNFLAEGGAPQEGRKRKQAEA